MTIETVLEAIAALQSTLVVLQAAEMAFDKATRKLEAMPEYKAWDETRDNRRETQNELDHARRELDNALDNLYLGGETT